MIKQLVEPVAKLDYRTLCESLIRTFGMNSPVNWESSLPAPQQQQLFGGELLRIIADHPTISLQHDIRALCWPKGTVSQLLFMFVRLNDERLPKSQIERITRRFVGGLDAERYAVWFIGNQSQTMLKVVLAGREGKKTVCKTLTLEAGQWYKTYDLILETVAKGNAEPVQMDMFATREPSLLWKTIWKTFDISIVNKYFYRDIKAAFDSLITALSNCKGILTTPEQRTQFAVRLLGRLIFCWFLKKKGIVRSDALSSATVKPCVNYYHELLEPLFFEVFNTPENKRKPGLPASIANLRFLNGGLFEPQTDDCQGNWQLLIPNDWFADFFGGTLERYNFTVDENSSASSEIAIDPEMLGRIFENLLAEQNEETGASARKQTGSFYTPREIVEYMVEESLIAYLGSECADFVHTGDLSDDMKPQVTALLEKLNRLKTIDIAAGSGAFPMGMLQKVVMLKQALNKALSQKVTTYRLKLETIENSIYGVDIQPMAIELSRLRCWLSLIVDEEPDAVQPLPNLDFKFVCADSLIDLGYKAFLEQCQKQGGLLFLQAFEMGMKELEDVRHKFFDMIHNHSKKVQLKERFIEIQKEITRELGRQKLLGSEFAYRISKWDPFDDSKSAPFFSPVWMFGITDGFDIAIGNPPFIQIQNFSGKPQQKAWEAQKYATYAKTGDVYCLFYERGFKLLAQNGVLTYISSNKWMRAGYGKATREFFLEQGSIGQLIDFGDSQIFENATTYTNILLWHKQKDMSSPLSSPSDSIGDPALKSGFPITTSGMTTSLKVWDLSKTYAADTSLPAMLEKQGVSDPLFTEDSFVIASGVQALIKKRIEEVGVPLKKWNISIYRGILTGLNEAFIISGKKKDELVAQDPKCAEIIKPILRGRDIKRYKADFADLWMVSTFPALNLDINNYSSVREYLLTFGKKLEQSGESGCRKKTSNKWFEVQDTIAYHTEIAKEKIVLAEIVFDSAFYYDTEGYSPEATAFLLTGEHLKYLTALLNSKLLTYAFKAFYAGGDLRGDTFRYKKAFLENLPIPQITAEAQRPFETLVDKILEAKKKSENTSSYEAEIDKLVYALYGLTDDEIAVVEGKR